MNRWQSFVGLVVVLCAAGAVRAGLPWEMQAKLTASDPDPSDRFGISVGMSGGFAIVGAVYDDERASNAGAAYFFQRTGPSSWSQAAKLTDPNGAADDYFGNSVSISGNYAIVGNVWDDDKGTNSGSAYVFEYDAGNWSPVAKLTASDGTAGREYGNSVAVEGNYAFVGTSYANKVYVYSRGESGWSETAILVPSAGNTAQFFGQGLSAKGDRVVVCDQGDDQKAPGAGAAYVFKRSGTTWEQVAKLMASDAAAGDCLARCSITEDWVVLGAVHADDNGTDSGSAYVFRTSDWSQAAKLIPSDGNAYDFFGSSVSVDGNHMVVTAGRDDDAGTDAGSAYFCCVNEEGAWTFQQKWTAPDAAAGDLLAASFIWGNYAILGAEYQDGAGIDAGAAYILAVPEPATLSLLALGFALSLSKGGLAVMRRRRR